MYYFLMFFIAYALGIIFCVYFNFAYILIAAILFAIINSFISKKLLPSLLIVLIILLSYFSVTNSSKSVLTQYINSDVPIIAKINNIQSNNLDSNFIGYNAEVIYIETSKIKENTIIYIPKSVNVEINSIISLNANISEISSNKNRMLYNYKDSLRAKKIFVNVFYKDGIKLVKRNYSAFSSFSNFCVDRTEKLFRKYLSEDNSNTLLSVILGDVKYLDKDYYKSIQRTGLAHIFAVSGSHVIIIYASFFKLFSFLGLKRKTAWLLAWILLWIYGFIIGFPVTVLRSLLTFNFLFGSEILFRKYNSVNSLVISAFILLIINPYYLFDVGFQLSYMAALCLLVKNRIIKKNSDKSNIDNKSKESSEIKTLESLKKLFINVINKIYDNLWLYVFIQVFTLPIMSYYFNFVSVIGIIFNLLIVPLFDKIIIFAFLIIPISLISPYTSILPLKLLDYVLDAVDYIINVGSRLDITGLEISSMNVLSSIYYYLFLAIILYFLINKKLQYKSFIFSALSIFYIIDFIVVPMKFNGLNINIIDVGQGMFLNIGYKGYNLIFDVGSNSKDIGKYVAVPYLTKHGRKNIDAVFISHFHEDHYNGLNDLLENCNVKKIYTSHISDENLIDRNYAILSTNQAFNIADRFSIHNLFATLKLVEKRAYNLNIKVLWPDKGYFSENENNMSNVFLLEYENVKILITGDIEKEVEDVILDRLVDIDIVIVPHHGSKTSSSEEFINKIKPEIAIFCYGKNTYGIPSGLVIDRYREAGSKILSTFIDGEINIMVNKDEIYYNTYIGNHSDSMNEIYKYNTMLNFQAFIVIILFSCFATKYIKDKTVNYRI